MHTKDTIINLLNKHYDNNDHRFVERSILALYSLQTFDERKSGKTRHLNNLGFSAATVKEGTYLAKWLASGKHLNGSFLNKAYSIATHHASQIARIANDSNLRNRVQENLKKTPGF